jgi:UDP-N-acetylglucosamine--N-acetylmuramyl-(pentapeptide) pyrophosphoryl-undecaprenol N-acetylglucosamine transferase
VRLLITGGGTGGHIYPALAVARCFAPSELVGWAGRAGSLEAAVAAREDLPVWPVRASGVSGVSPTRKAGGALAALVGTAQSLRLIRRLRPDAVLATGGYVTGPVGLAAALLGVPVVILNQDATPGLTNRMLARVAWRVAVAWPEAAAAFPRGVRPKVVVTGTPVRPEVVAADRQQARSQLGLPEGQPAVLVFGGSQGAAALNRVAADLVRRLSGRATILWVTGPRYHAAERASLGGDVPPGVQIMPYAHDMPRLLAAADLAVTRAGAATLAELCARGLPAVLIPSPHVTRDHQTLNARLLERAGAAVHVGEARLAEAADLVERLLADPAALSRMARAARDLARPEAAQRLADLLRQAAAGGAG